jgi:hypothetical protein
MRSRGIDPVERVEATPGGRLRRRVERDDALAELSGTTGADHGSDLAGGIKHDGGAGPGEQGRDADRGGLEAAGAGEHERVGGAGAAGVDQERGRAARAPGGGVGGIERALARGAIEIDAVGLADDDAAMARIGAGEEAAGVLHREPVGVAMVVRARALQRAVRATGPPARAEPCVAEQTKADPDPDPDPEQADDGFWSVAPFVGVGGANAICVLANAACEAPALRTKVAPMAIAFARARYLSRSTGGNACRSASYNAREAIADLRTGERYSFAHRDAPEHHAVLLPEGADAAALGTSAQLWNVAEGAERRRDAQVAREIVLALPADRELSPEDRIELARSFAREHFVSRGLAVQLDVHAPHDAETGEGEGANERANHHAHLLITTRRVEGDRLASRKARDLDPEVRSFKGRAAVTDGERWGALWAAHQDAYFAEHGIEVRVEATAAVPGKHIGPIRMRTEGSPAVARAEEIARENAAAARDPETVLRVLTRNNATFTQRELDRHLAKHIQDKGEHLDVKGRVLGHGEALPLYDPATGRASGRYTTREVRAQERAALDDGARLAEGRAIARWGPRPWRRRSKDEPCARTSARRSLMRPARAV